MIFRAALLACLFLPAPILAQSVTGTGPADDPTCQTENDWVDDRWSKSEIGPFIRATIDTPRKRTAKAIAIKLGPNDEAAICFDTDLLRYSAAWTGGFVRSHGQRYGLIAPLTPTGESAFSTDAVPGWAQDDSFADPRVQGLGALPRQWAKYKGLYRSVDRIVLAYSVGQASVFDSPWFSILGNLPVFTRSIELTNSSNHHLLRIADFPGSTTKITEFNGTKIGVLAGSNNIVAVSVIGDGFTVETGENALNVRISPVSGVARGKIFICSTSEESLPAFAALVRNSPVETLHPHTKGAPPRWVEPLTTRGFVDRSNSPFAIDTITIPYENPWNALFFVTGHDFFNDGSAALSTIHGDVWLVRGLDDTLENIKWKRFATGLYQPLGLKIISDKVHVMERDQITILHDLNNDGEADFYENFNNDCIGAGGGHSYTTCLETDSRGDFYFTKCAEDTPHGGTVLKVPKNGAGIEVIATGFRNPNGMAIGPDDLITVADQQGDWVPETRLDVIRPGGFYGFIPMHKRASAPSSFEPPLAWIPRSIDNSAGGQVWIPQNYWGPLGGQLLHLSFGRCTMMLVLRDQHAHHPMQGAVVPLPGRFASGVCRGRFNSRDGHLYVTGLRGWQTSAVRDGCFQRVRYKKEIAIPVAYSIHPDEVRLTFSQSLDRELAQDLESYDAEIWNYKWTSNYGSPDFSVSNPDKQGRDSLKISAALLHNDRSVVLKIPGLKQAHQLAISYNLETAEGATIQNVIYATINSLSGNQN
jgi:hypothetical protein